MKSLSDVVKQTRPIRPPKSQVAGEGGRRRDGGGYVYRLTAFVCLGAFLFGWDQGVMSMIVADARWLELMRPSSDWTVGFVISIYNVGCAAGALTTGTLADSCGRERTIALASGVFIVGAVLQAASCTVTQITIGRLILGVGVGAYSAGVPLYISEIAPAAIRGRIGGISLMILCFGEMVVFLVVYGSSFIGSADWWRLPLAIQIVPALVLALGCWWWVPPSPRWLLAQDRVDCALEVLCCLHGSDEAQLRIGEMRESVLAERHKVARTGWMDMFRGPVLRITFLGLGIQFLQQLTGTNAIFYYAPTMFKSAGLDESMGKLATAGIGVVLFLTAWIPVFYFDRLGRKTWLQIGTVGLFGALVGIASLLRHAQNHPGDKANYAIVVFPYIFFTFFNASWSSASWTYAAEIFPVKLRAKGNALCTAALWMANFLVAQLTPPIASAIGWGLHVLLAGFCAVAFIFVRYALVETRGRTLEEMSHLFGLEDDDGAVRDPDSEERVLLPDADPDPDPDSERHL